MSSLVNYYSHAPADTTPAPANPPVDAAGTANQKNTNHSTATAKSTSKTVLSSANNQQHHSSPGLPSHLARDLTDDLNTDTVMGVKQAAQKTFQPSSRNPSSDHFTTATNNMDSSAH